MSTIAIVCGGRDYDDADRVSAVLGLLGPSLVINGDCPAGSGGADKLAQSWAHSTGTDLINVPALFDARGKKAGPQRNALMLALLKMMALNGKGPRVVVVAFPGGRGTKGMVELAEGADVEVIEVLDGEAPVADVETRMSRCSYGHKETKTVDGVVFGRNWNGRQWLWGNFPMEAPSSPELPFFESVPDKPHDRHFCGCMGWS